MPAPVDPAAAGVASLLKSLRTRAGLQVERLTGTELPLDVLTELDRVKEVWAEGESIEPAIVPLVPGGVACGDFVSVRSYKRSRRAPGANPRPSFATVGAEAIFSNVPVTVSFLPLSVAVAAPMPATADEAGLA